LCSELCLTKGDHDPAAVLGLDVSAEVQCRESSDVVIGHLLEGESLSGVNACELCIADGIPRAADVCGLEEVVREFCSASPIVASTELFQCSGYL
jgi:hypothetical protein